MWNGTSAGSTIAASLAAVGMPGESVGIFHAEKRQGDTAVLHGAETSNLSPTTMIIMNQGATTSTAITGFPHDRHAYGCDRRP